MLININMPDFISIMLKCLYPYRYIIFIFERNRDKIKYLYDDLNI